MIVEEVIVVKKESSKSKTKDEPAKGVKGTKKTTSTTGGAKKTTSVTKTTSKVSGLYSFVRSFVFLC